METWHIWVSAITFKSAAEDPLGPSGSPGNILRPLHAIRLSQEFTRALHPIRLVEIFIRGQVVGNSHVRVQHEVARAFSPEILAKQLALRRGAFARYPAPKAHALIKWRCICHEKAVPTAVHVER